MTCHRMLHSLLLASMIVAVSAFAGPSLSPGPSMARGNLQTRKSWTKCQSGSGDGRTGEIGLHMRYVAMNRFKVKIGCEEEFSTVWRQRESKLGNFPGFQEFMLLKIDNESQRADDDAGDSKAGYTEFVSHTIWAHKMDFDDWRESQSFKQSHGTGGRGGDKTKSADATRPSGASGGMSKIGDLLLERPLATTYEAVLIEPTPPEHKGGLWEFEEEAAYFDGDLQQ